MFNFINNINPNTLIYIVKKYCDIEFTLEEANTILPYLKSMLPSYYSNPSKRSYYLDEIMKLLEKLNIK